MSELKVIALISGGKDSFFSILHCQANGHEIVALANLYPETSAEDSENEDIDSFMYQTVGHSIIPLYAEALGIPLYRQKILGGSGSMERDYAPSPNKADNAQEEDETESLIPLLKKVKEAHPDANAISTGAILSTYQRTRIESIALRLGLIPLSYLWQFPLLPPYSQTSLLEDMKAVGQDSRIIKVASGALNESFLWEDVADQANVAKMVKRMEMFGGSSGGAILGEGGEFETLAVNGPSILWRKRIEVGSVEVVKGEGGSAVVRLKDANVVEKNGNGERHGGHLRVPDLLDTEFAAILPTLETFVTFEHGMRKALHDSSLPDEVVVTKPAIPTNSFLKLDVEEELSRQGLKELPRQGLLQISNMCQSSGTPFDQLKGVLEQLCEQLNDLNLDASSVVSTTLLLRSMTDFTALNPIYGSFFTTPNPPSRVTVACGGQLPLGVDVMLSVKVELGPGNRKHRQGLHVQSRSYWAPANIGPYSQAISPCHPLPCKTTSMKRADRSESDSGTNEGSERQPRNVHIAGQIPLVPASMEMVTSDHLTFQDTTWLSKKTDFIAQTILSLQHLFRIGRAMDVQWWTGAVAFISPCSPEEGNERAKIATTAWKEIHLQALDSQQKTDNEEEDDEEELDVWDLRNRSFGFRTPVEGKSKKEQDMRSLLPDYGAIKNTCIETVPPTTSPEVYVAQVAGLPRGADIEWYSNGVSNIVPALSSPTIWHRISDYEGMAAYTPMFDIRLEFTVYTTKPLPKFLRNLRPAVIPCLRTWCEREGGNGLDEIDGFVEIRVYPK